MSETEGKKPGFFARLKAGLTRSTQSITQGITRALTRKRLDQAALDELEELLIGADMGAKVAADVVVLDGIRWLSDRDMLRENPKFRMVFITADIALRYARRKTGQKVGEAEVSWEQFQKEEMALTEQFIEEIGKSADYSIENNGTEEEYRDKVKDFCALSRFL